MGKKAVKVLFGYCSYCEKEIENPVKKSLDEMEKTILAVVFISTIGVGILVSLILIILLHPIAIWSTLITIGVTIVIYELYTKVIRKSIYCPTCESKLQFSSEAFLKPKDSSSKPKTPKQKILAKIEENKITRTKHLDKVEEELEISTCPYCGNRLDDDYESCPYCKSML